MGHKWFYLWSIRGHSCDSMCADAFRYFQIIQLLENTNGHEWVVNDFIYGLFVDIRVIQMADAFRYIQIIQLLENTNVHEWVINGFIYGLFVVIRVIQ